MRFIDNKGMNPEDITKITYGYNSGTETHDITQTTISRSISYNENRTEKTVSTQTTTTTTTIQRNPGAEPVVNTTQTIGSNTTVSTINQTPDPDSEYTGTDMQGTIETISSTRTTESSLNTVGNPDLSGSEFDTMNAAVSELQTYVREGLGASGGNWITDPKAYNKALSVIGGVSTFGGAIATAINATKLSKGFTYAGAAILLLNTTDKNFNNRNTDRIRLPIGN